MRRDFIIVAPQGFGKSEMARILTRNDKKVVTMGAKYPSAEEQENVDTIIMDEWIPLTSRMILATSNRPRVIALTNNENIKLPKGFIPYAELTNGAIRMIKVIAEEVRDIMDDSRIVPLANTFGEGETLKIYANGFDSN